MYWDRDPRYKHNLIDIPKFRLLFSIKLVESCIKLTAIFVDLYRFQRKKESKEKAASYFRRFDWKRVLLLHQSYFLFNIVTG